MALIVPMIIKYHCNGVRERCGAQDFCVRHLLIMKLQVLDSWL